MRTGPVKDVGDLSTVEADGTAAGLKDVGGLSTVEADGTTTGRPRDTSPIVKTSESGRRRETREPAPATKTTKAGPPRGWAGCRCLGQAMTVQVSLPVSRDCRFGAFAVRASSTWARAWSS
ncbi:hypothetical protein GCM10017788_52430 [Amycolatopsis acidiphila]|nr:hypothetical protein GCM10017788_52430 [Amycolatopsis acidiphila]